MRVAVASLTTFVLFGAIAALLLAWLTAGLQGRPMSTVLLNGNMMMQMAWIILVAHGLPFIVVRLGLAVAGFKNPVAFAIGGAIWAWMIGAFFIGHAETILIVGGALLGFFFFFVESLVLARVLPEHANEKLK